MVTFILTYYISIIFVLTIFQAISLNSKTFPEIAIGASSQKIGAIVLAFIVAYSFGSRPLTYDFGDTGNYAFVYTQIEKGLLNADNQEFLWGILITVCQLFWGVRGYIMFIAFLYVGINTLASIKLFPKNAFVALLFDLGSLSFFTYGTNGIRNGFACSLVLLGIAYMCGNKKEKISGIALSILAIGFHKSVMLPTSMALLSLFFLKDFKVCYKFWIASIIISIIAGSYIADFFASLGFDDRLSYLTNNEYEDRFSHTGFRWDFLLYSAMPIWLGYHIIIKKGIRDVKYEFLLNTYVLSNAFWVMVIRSSFTNRFAYLSWFLYAFVLAYPLLKMDIWGDEQGKRLAQIMVAQVGFTWFMYILVW